MSKSFCRALLCLLLCFSILPAGVVCAEETITAEVDYYSVFLKKDASWNFEYSDRWFEADSDAYSHSIARASLGMAMSAFRSKTGPADQNVRNYLTALGFQDLTAEDYAKNTSIDTIATMIGHKELPNGETLLAVAICGQGYQNEWLSNFDIGDQQEHRGFSAAAQKVVKRVESYIQTHELKNVRLWLNGYSRSAAVANLTGASLMEKGLFTEKNAFIYTFATPRTTREPVVYNNLFNVVGKFDPVTKVPYREWGFERHGTTLYTPAQETDSDYRERLQAADVPFYEMTGVHLWSSPSFNQHLSVIEAYLLSNIPTTTLYDTYMSQHIANAWSKPDALAVLAVLEAMAEIPNPDGSEKTAAQENLAEELIDYIASAVVAALGDDPLYYDQVVTQNISPTVPILLEHIPDVYLAWMFSSDDPEKIFSDKTQYVQLVVSGDAEVNLFDQRGGFVLSMDPDGTLLETTENERYLKRIRPVEDRPMISAMEKDGRMIFVLPQDQGFPFTITARSDSDLEYYGIYYDITRSAPTMSSLRMLNMEEGEEYLAFSLTPRGQTVMNAEEALWGDAHATNTAFSAGELLSVSEADRLASFNPIRMSVRGVLRTLFIAAAVILLLAIVIIVLLIRFICRRVRRRKVKTA